MQKCPDAVPVFMSLFFLLSFCVTLPQAVHADTKADTGKLNTAVSNLVEQVRLLAARVSALEAKAAAAPPLECVLLCGDRALVVQTRIFCAAQTCNDPST